MDIIDIMLAKAMTPQGRTEAYATKANKAMQDATKAKADAETAIASVTAAADDIAAAQSAAATLLETAQTALATAQAAQGELPIAYQTTGQNTDGYMTQKAVTDALETKANASDLTTKANATDVTNALALKADASALAAKADKTYVDQQIAAIPAGDGSGNVTVNTNLGSENAGRIVIVGNDGNITAGTATENDIISALVINGGYTARNAVGLEINFADKTFTRTQGAVGKTAGSDFNSYLMFGGRRRCIVDDNGEIIAFYGANDYTEINANYQVMVYQPKFYYQRIPLSISANQVGKVIERDSIIISTTQQNGFKLHPLFKNINGEELEYVLLGAYESGIYSTEHQGTYGFVYNSVNFNEDKLVSKADTKPLTGSSNLTIERAEQLATNRGTGWHIFNIKAESANQMLEMIEFGTLNGQAALGKGVSNIITNSNYNQSAITGATSSLGNNSGSAPETIIETNGTRTTETENGKVSISYRGLENPWGNTWTMLGGILVFGNGSSNGGIPYICNDYNYSYSMITNNYTSADFSLPNSNGWISKFGYGNSAYDWLFMPAEVSSDANSALPVGDNGWFDSNLTGLRIVSHGGSWSFEDANGPFYYACDKAPNDSTYKSYGTRLMFIPTKNSTYTSNIAKWQQEMEGDSND